MNTCVDVTRDYKTPVLEAAGNGAPAIAVSAVFKSFGKQKVLDGISFKVQRGETLVVLGRSGTGKSVLLKIVVGLQKQDTGNDVILG